MNCNSLGGTEKREGRVCVCVHVCVRMSEKDVQNVQYTSSSANECMLTQATIHTHTVVCLVCVHEIHTSSNSGYRHQFQSR